MIKLYLLDFMGLDLTWLHSMRPDSMRFDHTEPDWTSLSSTFFEVNSLFELGS